MQRLSLLERRKRCADGAVREIPRAGDPHAIDVSLGDFQTHDTFVDRLFLTWYSAEAVAGAVTGLFTTLAVMALFTGTGEYLTTFIAQYLGAGRPQRIGPVLWPGVYFSILADEWPAVKERLTARLSA